MSKKRTLRKIQDPKKSSGISPSKLLKTPNLTEYKLGGNIQSVNFPNSIKVGEPHGLFKRGMVVYGPIQAEKITILEEYINWNDEDAGIRLNSGIVQFKNTTGDWQAVGSQTDGVTTVDGGNGITVNQTTGDVTVTVQAEDSTINVGSSGIKVVNVPNSLTVGNGVTLDSGTTYNGSSAVTLSIDAADTTINVASGGVSVVKVPNALTVGNGLELNNGTTYDGSSALTVTVDESELTIPNASLQNDSITVNTGQGLTGGGNCDLGATLNLVNAGVISITAGGGMSVDQSTGAVTVTNTGQSSIAAYSAKQPDNIGNGAITLAASDGTVTTVPFATAAISDSAVVSGVSSGEFTLSTSLATGNYMATATFPVTAFGSDGNTSNYELKVLADLDANGSFTTIKTIPINSLAVSGARTLTTTDAFKSTATSAKLKYTVQKLTNTGTNETLTGYPVTSAAITATVQITLV
jgi:hypothetical protein